MKRIMLVLALAAIFAVPVYAGPFNRCAGGACGGGPAQAPVQKSAPVQKGEAAAGGVAVKVVTAPVRFAKRLLGR